ncbi:hypothetical protein CHS0354_028968 [Potamilus streckersoni]|uniref:Uncharacterized protein n=1 Tax=Potamilus streckersoni TaxID=2493646 RepID=A0AAE0VSH5_9BIVA|nr:hypothetical protein CHS0354_028968 [Potamilus streckersoni]
MCGQLFMRRCNNMIFKMASMVAIFFYIRSRPFSICKISQNYAEFLSFSIFILKMYYFQRINGYSQISKENITDGDSINIIIAQRFSNAKPYPQTDLSEYLIKNFKI